MSDDVVAELDAVLEEDGEYAYCWPVGILKRARDEIVALRQRCALHNDLEFVSKNELTETREAALEEAARACVGSGAIVAEARLCASAIRALKER